MKLKQIWQDFKQRPWWVRLFLIATFLGFLVGWVLNAWFAASKAFSYVLVGLGAVMAFESLWWLYQATGVSAFDTNELPGTRDKKIQLLFGILFILGGLGVHLLLRLDFLL